MAVSFLALGSPIVATLLGYLIRDQTLSGLQIAGMAVILLAVVLGQPRPPRPKPEETPAAPSRITGSPSPVNPLRNRTAADDGGRASPGRPTR